MQENFLRARVHPCRPVYSVNAIHQEFKAKHPKSNPQAQKRKSGKPALKYTGADAEFTDSSDDEGMRVRKAGPTAFAKN